MSDDLTIAYMCGSTDARALGAVRAERDELQRRLDLAANALVPIPDGKPCERRKCFRIFFSHEGVLYHDLDDKRPTDVITGRRHDIPWDAIVQPVRMVPLRDLLGQTQGDRL